LALIVLKTIMPVSNAKNNNIVDLDMIAFEPFVDPMVVLCSTLLDQCHSTGMKIFTFKTAINGMFLHRHVL
jgi:hypothetical protein